MKKIKMALGAIILSGSIAISTISCGSTHKKEISETATATAYKKADGTLTYDQNTALSSYITTNPEQIPTAVPVNQLRDNSRITVDGKEYLYLKKGHILRNVSKETFLTFGTSLGETVARVHSFNEFKSLSNDQKAAIYDKYFTYSLDSHPAWLMLKDKDGVAIWLFLMECLK